MSIDEVNQFIAQQVILTGRVQGVGFRPYIYRLATQYHLVGWVKNQVGQVEIRIQGTEPAVNTFLAKLIPQAPPLAQPQIVSCSPCPLEELTTFTIRASEVTNDKQIHVPPDYFTCQDCLAELHDPQARRYRYPFINCTQCGPRYTLIYRLPYDRPHTSMADFTLCAECATEYHQPADRRFHAQPLACPHCGPQLYFHQQATQIRDTAAALTATVQALQAGQIVAVKGIGGYHLLCVADNEATILRLRQKKPRPAKPLAVMLPLAAWQTSAESVGIEITAIESTLLQDPQRPIVLARKQAHYSLSTQIAPGLAEIGVMLPYSPLHHLLLEDLAVPVVATSANLSGEPVLTANAEVEQRLSRVADAFLHHNRPIVRPADDSVFRTIAGKPRPLRLGRGSAPVELNLPHVLPQPVLAVGSHLKNTIALAWDSRVVVSPHVGDLDAPRSLDVFTQLIDDFQNLYGVKAAIVAGDAHPNYGSSRWAKQSHLPVIPVFHHHAHASALAGEFPHEQPWLIFTWDGVGLGVDGTLWGGEALYGQPGHWQRLASLRPFYLPGGEKAGREPWRSALALCWEINSPWHEVPVDNTDLLYQAWQQRFNCPQTTAVGRLFDAAAALTGILQTAHFEGQGPMLLEAVSNDSTSHLELPLHLTPAGLWQTDWSPLVHYLLTSGSSIAEKSAVFHNSLAHALLNQAKQLRTLHAIGSVGLCGGVFQNRRLTELAKRLLQEAGFTVFLMEQLPTNDASISFGQVIEVVAITSENS
jgi:hydrogenase maturation protein HypF